MGEIQSPRPALLLLAAFSRYPEALNWARLSGCEKWGAIALESGHFPFDDTTYYEASMGPRLLKVFFVFEQLIDPEQIVAIKRYSNKLEEHYRDTHHHQESRPLNLDPGYLTEAKLVLATTKDRDHRIYLGDGIYAEGTLHFSHGQWKSRPWTYPDYRREDYHRFFSQCRVFLRERLRAQND